MGGIEAARRWGTLHVSDWTHAAIGQDETLLRIPHGELPVGVQGANATGLSLVSAGDIGADLLRLPAGARFPPHTHVGHHVLVVLAGLGTVTFSGEIRPTRAGQIYIIEASVPHAVGAITDHVILAVGAPHKQVGSADRMSVVGYEEVLSPQSDLTCLICRMKSVAPQNLHELGCPHCPCLGCAHARGLPEGGKPAGGA